MPFSLWTTFIFVFAILKNAAVSSLRVVRSTRTMADESGSSGMLMTPFTNCGLIPLIPLRYTIRPLESRAGDPIELLPSIGASCERGTAATRAMAPFPSSTNIERSRGSMNSVESPKYEMIPPADGP